MSYISSVAAGKTASAMCLDTSLAGRGNITTSHIPALDGLRGIAILLVLWFHFRGYLGGEPIQCTLAIIGEFGWIGVDLFFVISGFLITRILLQTKEKPDYFRSFYTRRALRIFPLYYASLAVLFLAPMSFMSHSLPVAHDRLWFWIYLANWNPLFEQIRPGSAAHFWSLSVEEQFYLVWPLLVWALSRKQFERVVMLVICTAPIVRIAMIFRCIDSDWIYKNPFCRMDTLAFGAGIALLLGRISPALIKHAGVLSLLVFCASLAYFRLPTSAGRSMQAYGFSAIALGCAATVASVVSAKTPALIATLNKNWLRAIGERSYGIYIFHMPVVEIAKHFFEPQMIRMASCGLGFVVVISLVLASGAIAFLSFRYFEQPILKLKRFI